MAIECYNIKCEHHSCNSADPDEDGPYCYQGKCLVGPMLHSPPLLSVFNKTPPPPRDWSKEGVILD